MFAHAPARIMSSCQLFVLILGKVNGEYVEVTCLSQKLVEAYSVSDTAYSDNWL